jgi:hypothetical protein
LISFIDVLHLSATGAHHLLLRANAEGRLAVTAYDEPSDRSWDLVTEAGERLSVLAALLKLFASTIHVKTCIACIRAMSIQIRANGL